MKQILFDETHDEAIRANDNEESGFFRLAQELKKLGYEVRETEKPLGEELEGTDVLVIAFPQREFKSEERDLIGEFVAKGGGLLLLGEWANLHGVSDCLNGLSKPLGVGFRNDRLMDFDARYTRDDEIMKGVLGVGDMAYLLRIVNFEEHPATENVKSISYLAGCTLDTDKENALVWADETCFADEKIDQLQDRFEDEGPFIVVAGKKIEKGRIVCTGDSSALSNRFLESEDNKRFAIQVFQWLGRDR